SREWSARSKAACPARLASTRRRLLLRSLAGTVPEPRGRVRGRPRVDARRRPLRRGGMAASSPPPLAAGGGGGGGRGGGGGVVGSGSVDGTEAEAAGAGCGTSGGGSLLTATVGSASDGDPASFAGCRTTKLPRRLGNRDPSRPMASTRQ